MREIDGMRHPVAARARFALLACAAAWGLGGIAVAAAQEAGEAESPPAAEAVQEIPWDTSCSQVSRHEEPDCEMSQLVIVPQSRQVLLRIELHVPGNGSGARMMLQLPHGTYLPGGVTLAIDGEEWQRTEMQTCDPQGCYAGVEIDENAVTRLEAGEQLAVTFQSLSREEVSVPVDLNGFTDAYARIR